ncbi:MAG: hypothetical protein ACI3XR_05905 [Eubacteriales bacterium]
MNQSKLLSLDVNFYISFQFDGEKLTAISMSPDGTLEGPALNSRYNEIQKALVNKLGHPHNPLRSIMNYLDPDSRSNCWQSNGIRIEHDLQNRFGMEEIVTIEL